jgi:uncharacterized membrane protein
MRLYSKIIWFAFVAIMVASICPAMSSAKTVETGLILTFLPNNSNVNMTAGKDNLLTLNIKNAGPNTATNIRLSADKPEGWQVNFVPSIISSLDADKNQTVEVHIKPDSTAARTGYSITIFAQADETQQSQYIYVNITEASFWIWIGGALAILIGAAFVFIFLRSNRQKT